MMMSRHVSKSSAAAVCGVAAVVAVSARASSDPWRKESALRRETAPMVKILESVKSLSEWPEDAKPITAYTEHEARKVRWFACGILRLHAAKQEAGSRIRKDLIAVLASKTRDQSVQRSVSKWLVNFSPSDFTAQAADDIRAAFATSTKPDLILLVGLIYDPVKDKKKIDELASGKLRDAEGYINVPAWSALSVKARHGDRQSIEKLLKAAEEEKDLRRRSELLVRLAYVRRKPVVDFLGKYLKSDLKLRSIHDATVEQPIALYAAKALARMLEGFPHSDKAELPWLNEKELARCRKWMDQLPPRQDEIPFR